MSAPDVAIGRPEHVTVVMVDDHQMLLESLVRLLNHDPSIEVVGTAGTATTGIEAVRALRPDIVVMDYQLPDMDGAEATRTLLRDQPNLKVIILTGSETQGAYFAAMEAGAIGWIRKTRAAQDLLAAIHAARDGRQVSNDELANLPPLEDIAVHYQPIVDITDESIVGLEALVRWPRSDRGMVYPDEFLPLAEETGYIHQLGHAIGQRAANQLHLWQERVPDRQALWLTLNVSGSSLVRPGFPESVLEIIQTSHIAAQNLVLEVTETVLVGDAPSALDCMHALKDLGVQLALDDFGTAFSSLSYLRTFPFDLLKIDTSFTAELPHSTRALQLVEAVAQLAGAIGLRSIAEGIEREEQRAALQAAGWTLGQGYLFARPQPPEEITALLER